jgi:hypothetical protein
MKRELAFVLVTGLAFWGCGSDESVAPAPEGEYLGLEQPADGFQVRNQGSTVEPGADVEFCEVGQLPGDPSQTYYVRVSEFGNAPFSHHLIVSAAEPGSPVDQKLREYAVGEQVPCLSAEFVFGNEGMFWVGGTQQPYTLLAYPPGVGREYRGGQRIVFDYHYFNTSDQPIEARSAFNFHLGKAEDVEFLARRSDFNNYTIDTPAKGTGKFTGECAFKQDVMIGGLTRHTHRWGTDYSVWFEGGARHGEKIWTSTDWQHETNYRFPEPLLMKKGEGFRFECNYANTEDRRLRFGTSATDEMCILFGMVWNAGTERDLPSQNCAITWVDSEGVGHVAEEGFPRATQAEADICTAAGTPGDACRSCQCGACAGVLIKCATDPDCKAILDCLQTGTSDCNDVADQHSSALGLLFQSRSCVEASGCAAQCPQ